MARSTKVSITLPPASYALLQQAAQENGINGAAAASLILQAALARRISGLVPKRPGKSGSGGRTAPADSAAPSAADYGRPAAPDVVLSSGPPQGVDARRLST